MPIHNADIAEMFNRLADLLEIDDANPFRVRAYRNAARTLGSLPRSVVDMLREGEELSRLPGIGKDLAHKIEVIVETGRLPALSEIERQTPGGLVKLLSVPGLGPKRVRMLHEKLGIEDVEALAAAARAGALRRLAGFGEKNRAQHPACPRDPRRRGTTLQADRGPSNGRGAGCLPEGC